MYLLSIVIPTRNRQYYALQSVKQIYNVTDDRVQIVIRDNSDDDSLKAMLDNEHFNSRVKYDYIEKRIPGVDNYAGGIAASDGEYICCIGDDDGVLRCIVDLVEWAKKNQIPVIKPGVQASYIWPGTSTEFPTGCLTLQSCDSSSFTVNPQQELIGFLESGCLDLPNALLVKAYHGIVRKDMFDYIYNKTGRYCGGLSPDIYLSISLSLNISSLLCINMPMTIFGACRQSTTGDSINKTNVSKLEDAPHFIGQPYTWSDKVPRFYCGTNIWADSAMHALDEMGAEDYKKRYSIVKLTAECLLCYPEYKTEIMENFNRNNCDMDELKAELKRSRPAYTKRRIKDFLRRRKFIAALYRKLRDAKKSNTSGSVLMKQGIENIIQAEEIINELVQPELSAFLDNTDKSVGGAVIER